MLKIAICDDDLLTTEMIERMLLTIQDHLGEIFDISIFYSGERFTKAITNGCLFELILMDIEMGKVDGIQAGHILRSDDTNDMAKLVYISSHEEFHLRLFDLQPSGFIKKPIIEEAFKEKLIPLIQKLIRTRDQSKLNLLPVPQKGKELLVPYKDILYLESSSRKVIIQTKDEKIEYYSTLNTEIEKLQSVEFIRIHQSYIVNFKFVKEIGRKKVILLNQEELPISNNNSALVQKKYLQFRGGLIV